MPKARLSISASTQKELLPLKKGEEILRNLLHEKGKKTTSDFQFSVLAGCCCIPRGSVTTYGKLASHIHKAAAARAVGTALSTNPVAPDAPCHRIVGSNRALTGFNGKKTSCELGRKQKLLEDEGVFIDGLGKVGKSFMI